MEVIKAPNAKLRVKTKPVKKITPSLKEITKNMIQLTKLFQDPEGVGLASTQIGLDECFFIGKIGPQKNNGQVDFKAFINPQITFLSKKNKKYFEGCLSIPNYFGEVRRSLIIKVTYQDLEGKKQQKTLRGIDAWIFQHEVDHLNGILFVDKVLQQKSKLYKFAGKDKSGTDIFEEISFNF